MQKNLGVAQEETLHFYLSVKVNFSLQGVTLRIYKVFSGACEGGGRVTLGFAEVAGGKLPRSCWCFFFACQHCGGAGVGFAEIAQKPFAPCWPRPLIGLRKNPSAHVSTLAPLFET